MLFGFQDMDARDKRGHDELLRGPLVLLDDLDNPVRARLDQDGTAVHDGVAIIVHPVFRRHVVIGDALLRQNRADPTSSP